MLEHKYQSLPYLSKLFNIISKILLCFLVPAYYTITLPSPTALPHCIMNFSTILNYWNSLNFMCHLYGLCSLHAFSIIPSCLFLFSLPGKFLTIFQCVTRISSMRNSQNALPHFQFDQLPLLCVHRTFYAVLGTLYGNYLHVYFSAWI